MSQKIFETYSRIKQYLRFSKAELIYLTIISIVVGFIFSMQHPGDELRLFNYLGYFFLATILAAISMFFRVALQKGYALYRGYYGEFKIWWEGLVASVVIAFLSLGRLPIVLLGNISSVFMIRHRLGEFRYGYSYEENSVVALWGFLANLYLATIFAILNLVFPGTFFFYTGMLMNIVMMLCFMIPVPWLDGLQIFFGSRFYYFISLAAAILASILLLSQTKIGLVIVIVGGTGFAIFRLLWGD